jgi:hypothetical protein
MERIFKVGIVGAGAITPDTRGLQSGCRSE